MVKDLFIEDIVILLDMTSFKNEHGRYEKHTLLKSFIQRNCSKAGRKRRMKKWLWIAFGIISLLLFVFLVIRNRDSDWSFGNDLF